MVGRKIKVSRGEGVYQGVYGVGIEVGDRLRRRHLSKDWKEVRKSPEQVW